MHNETTPQQWYIHLPHFGRIRLSTDEVECHSIVQYIKNATKGVKKECGNLIDDFSVSYSSVPAALSFCHWHHHSLPSGQYWCRSSSVWGNIHNRKIQFVLLSGGRLLSRGRRSSANLARAIGYSGFVASIIPGTSPIFFPMPLPLYVWSLKIHIYCSKNRWKQIESTGHQLADFYRQRHGRLLKLFRDDFLSIFGASCPFVYGRGQCKFASK